MEDVFIEIKFCDRSVTNMICFGTGGWRAEIGKDFYIGNIRLIAQALANCIKNNGKEDKPVVIGYDRRFLSAQAAAWVAEVLAANGISVLFMRRSVPTPLVMYIVKYYFERLFYNFFSHGLPLNQQGVT